MVLSPITAIVLAYFLADIGYKLGSDLQLGNERSERFAYIALGAVTGLVSLCGITFSNTVRGVTSVWSNLLLWALGCGIFGGVSFPFLFLFILKMLYGR